MQRVADYKRSSNSGWRLYASASTVESRKLTSGSRASGVDFTPNGRAGRKSPVVDTLIAACAHAYGLVIATADADLDAFGGVPTVYNPRTRTVSGYRPWTAE